MNLTSESWFLNWWLQGLKLLVPTSVKNIIYPAKKRVLIQLDSNKLTVSWPSKGTETYDLKSGQEQQLLLKKLNDLKQDKHIVVLCLAENLGLCNEIKLPIKAQSDLKQILDFEIGRQTPFSLDQVYSGYRVTNKNLQANSLNVDFTVIPNKQLEPKITELHNLGIKPQSVELYRQSGEPGINVLPQDELLKSSSRTKKLNSLLLFAMVILAIIAALMPFINIEKGIKVIDSQIEEARAGALEVNELRSQWTEVVEQQNRINDIIKNHRSSIVTLNKLTQLIPDDTWLTRLQIKGAVVRLQGESSAATALIPLIENSDSFSDTRFQSPITSNASTGNDRFQITTRELSQ